MHAHVVPDCAGGLDYNTGATPEGLKGDKR